MAPRHLLLASILLAAAPAAEAYCLHNQLPDRNVFIEQEPHPEKLREDRVLRLTLKPGQRHCCRNLDCNPGGRDESIVNLSVTIRGKPELYCVHEGDEYVKVTGDGTLRIMTNPRYPRRSSAPYVLRIRSGVKDLTGPRGLPCNETFTVKGKR